MLLMQLTLKEIDQIISFLQEPYPYELIKRLEQLRAETEFHILLENKKFIDRMNEEIEINTHGFGSSPVSNAYFLLEEGK